MIYYLRKIKFCIIPIVGLLLFIICLNNFQLPIYKQFDCYIKYEFVILSIIRDAWEH